jgi:hypothetical protein
LLTKHSSCWLGFQPPSQAVFRRFSLAQRTEFLIRTLPEAYRVACPWLDVQRRLGHLALCQLARFSMQIRAMPSDGGRVEFLGEVVHLHEVLDHLVGVNDGEGVVRKRPRPLEVGGWTVKPRRSARSGSAGTISIAVT